MLFDSSFFPICPIAAITGITASYLIFYTGRSRASQKIEVESVLDVVLCRKTLSFTLTQVNKVVGLSGLTSLAVSFLPGIERIISPNLLLAPFTSASMVTLTTFMLMTHAGYSVWEFYGTHKIPAISSYPSLVKEICEAKKINSDIDPLKKLKVKRICGTLAGVTALQLLEWYLVSECKIWNKIGVDIEGFYASNMTCMSLSSMVLGLMHFYLIEVDAQGALPMRPFGYAAMIMPIVSVVAQTL